MKSGVLSLPITPTVPLKFRALQDHLNRNYYHPDLEALRVVLSAVAAHPTIQGDPIWLFVQGPSGSGKTDIIINAIRKLLDPLEPFGMINRHSLISFNRGVVGGVLPFMAEANGARSGIFAFKDFTTLLSMREEERGEFVAQLREVYDGSFRRDTGTGHFNWIGKVTCIAACTPVLEQAWAVKRDLGERFLTVRWPRVGGTELAKIAGKQRGREKVIRDTTATLAFDFVKSVKLTNLPELPESVFEKVSNLAELVACLRAQVPRAPGGKREVLGEPCAEEPGRIHKSLSALVASHSALFSSSQVQESDLQIAKRVARDSIPFGRLNVFRNFPLEGEGWENPSTLATRSKCAPSTVVWHCDEMVALGALEGREENEVKEYRLSEKFRELIRGAELTL